MQIAHINIENMLGLTAAEIEPGQVTLLEGGNGAGKSAVLESIIAAFAAKGIPGQMVTSGADKGRVYIRLDDGHEIKATFTPDGRKTVTVTTPEGDKKGSPQTWLDGLFSAQIVNPVQFIAMTTAEKRKALLAALPIAVTQGDLLEWFGEALPVDTGKHGLLVLTEAENVLKERRRKANAERDGLLSEIATVEKDIPADFVAAEWEGVNTSALTSELQAIGRIAEEKRAALVETDRVDGVADDWLSTATIERTKAAGVATEIVRLDALWNELLAQATEHEGGAAAEHQRAADMRAQAEAVSVPDAGPIEEKLAAYSDAQRVLQQIANRDRLVTSAIAAVAEAMRLNGLVELARQKPRDLLAQSPLPIAGLEFTDDAILVDGLTIDSLSDGEQLALGVEIAKASAGPLGFICVDGAEKLDSENLQWLMGQADDEHQFFIGRVGDGALTITNAVE